MLDFKPTNLMKSDRVIPMDQDKTREFLQTFAELFSKLESAKPQTTKVSHGLHPTAQRHFSQILQNVLLIAVVCDTEGNILLCNDFLVEISGWTRDELIGRNWIDMMIPEEERDELHRLFVEGMASGSVPSRYENEIISKRGERRLIRFSNGLLVNEENETTHIVSFGEDITEQRKIEEALADEQRKMRLLYENNPDAIVVMDPSQRIIYANKKAETLSGKEVAELEGEFCYTAVMGFDKPCDDCVVGEVLKTKEPVVNIKHEVTASGKENWLQQTVYAVIDKKGEVESVVEIARDISDSVRTMQELTRSEERYRTLAEAAHDQIFIVDRDMSISYANGYSASLLGLRPEEIVGKRHVDLFPSEEAEHQVANLSHVFETGEPLCTERKIPFPSGEVWLETRLVPIINAGEATAVLGISRDVSERRKTEEALREGEKKFRMVVEQSRDGIFIATLDGKVVLYNDAMHRLTGYTAREINKRGWFYILFPDVKWRMEATILTIRAFKEELSYFELPIVRADGARAWLSFSVKPTVIEDKKFGLFVVDDITDRKHAEHRLKRAYEEEHRIAAALQKSLVRSVPAVPGVDVGVEYKTAFETEIVGGDLYDIFQLDDHKVGVLIGDVAGKGVSAAGLTETIRSSVRTLSYLNPSPSFVLDHTNHALIKQLMPTQSATAAFYVLDLVNGTLRGASAGHTKAIVHNPSGSKFFDVPKGLPLGTYSKGYEETAYQLEEMESVILYTDGLVGTGRDALEPDELLRMLDEVESDDPQSIVDGLVQAVNEYTEGRLADDVAVVAVRLTRKRIPDLSDSMIDMQPMEF
ncbi:MAG: PAS domain S-box protein [Candidatus Aquicultorales bacterium]